MYILVGITRSFASYFELSDSVGDGAYVHVVGLNLLFLTYRTMRTILIQSEAIKVSPSSSRNSMLALTDEK